MESAIEPAASYFANRYGVVSQLMFRTPTARLASRNARRQATDRGHTLDRFQREAGRPTAVCGCGCYVFVDRDTGGEYWGYGKLPVGPGTWQHCEFKP